MIVTRRASQRLLIDQLAETVEKGRVFGRDCDPRQRLLQSERRQFLGCMRQQIDADADRLDFGRRFENPAGNAGRVQRKPESEPANAGSDDDDLVHIFHPGALCWRLPG